MSATTDLQDALTEGEALAVSDNAGFRTEVNIAGHALVVDEPVAVGGTDQGPSPYGLISAALASCTAMTLHMYAKHKQLPLTGIRVLGTDLRPCGFGRAVLRNLLTFVDGFFNFLVGVLLVALTENWQRLGDFAARTIVVADDPSGVDPAPVA